MRLTLATIVTLACTACGPGKTTTTDSEPTTTLDPTSTSTTEGPTSTTTTTTTGTSPTTTGTPASCEAFLPDEILGDQTTITLTNVTDGPLWLTAVGCAGLPAMAIRDTEGKDHFVAPDPCFPPTCESLLEGECIRGCANCGVPAGLRLEPGASFSVLWAAADVEFMEMTAECAPGEGCAGECAASRERPAGSYDVTVSAFQQCLGTCDCVPPNPGGHCTLDGGIILSEELTVTVPLTFPDTLEIEVPLGG